MKIATLTGAGLFVLLVAAAGPIRAVRAQQPAQQQTPPAAAQPQQAAPAPLASQPFSDVPRDHWAFEAVEKLRQRGIITGYPGGTFNPPAAATRQASRSTPAPAKSSARQNTPRAAAKPAPASR